MDVLQNTIKVSATAMHQLGETKKKKKNNARRTNNKLRFLRMKMKIHVMNWFLV
jgi:hypothetical protein